MTVYHVTYAGPAARTTDRHVCGLLEATLLSTGYTLATQERDLQVLAEAPLPEDWLAEVRKYGYGVEARA